MHTRQSHRLCGFTLIELLVALAVLAILAGSAVPWFRDTLMNQRLGGATEGFYSLIQIGRSEAVQCNCRVVLCPSADGEACLASGADWHVGALLFRDANGNREIDPGEEVLRVEPPFATDVTGTSPVSRRRIVFQPNGLTPGSNATFTFCDPRGLAQARALVLSNTGRLRNGTASACPE